MNHIRTHKICLMSIAKSGEMLRLYLRLGTNIEIDQKNYFKT